MRKDILRNTLWSNANVFMRYGSSFVATALIAANYAPGEFGVYQLALTWLGLLEGVNFLESTHLRNHLVHHPEDENIALSGWAVQSLLLWLFVSIGCGFYLALGGDRLFGVLLLILSLRLIFRAVDGVQLVFDSRLRSDLTQKNQMLMMGSFNVTRILLAWSRVSLTVLSLSSAIQGLIAAIAQWRLKKQIRLNFRFQWDRAKLALMIRQGFSLSLIGFLSLLQTCTIAVLLAERMSAADYGNFQLVLKLVEPVATLGLMILSVNYTVLAHTLKEDPAIFRRRYFKLSALAVSMSLVFSLLMTVFPLNFMTAIFGEAYRKGLEHLWMGGGLILSTTVLYISVQHDMLHRRYARTIAKYVAVFLASTILIYQAGAGLTIQDGLLWQAIVPIIVVLLFETALTFIPGRRASCGGFATGADYNPHRTGCPEEAQGQGQGQKGRSQRPKPDQ